MCAIITDTNVPRDMTLYVVVSAESFRDRKNEVVIISPKKAYNICKFVTNRRYLMYNKYKLVDIFAWVRSCSDNYNII